MDVRTCLTQLTKFFEKKGIENAHVDAEWLLSHVLQCNRLELFLNYDQPLSVEEEDVLRQKAHQRGKRYPLQYILGTVVFYDQILKVDERALIPRPETEELVYQLNTCFSNQPPKRIIDLGTGSGAIAIALAALQPKVHIFASDAYSETLALATQNAHANRAHIQFIRSRWFEKITDTFDCIVSNPPYLSETEWEQAQPEVKCFEPKHALVAAENGLSDLKHLLQEGIHYLNEGGFMALETGVDQHKYLSAFATQCGYARTESRLDLNGYPRYFWAWK